MRSDRARSGAAIAAAALALAGCARTIAPKSVVDDAANDERAFWTAIETSRVITNNDALHGLFLSADGADPSASYEERLAAAKQRKWLSEDASVVDHPANQSATIGDVSVACCRMAGIKGGLTMQVLGPSPRYATRELVFMEILPDRTDTQGITGLEFIDLVSRIQDRIDLARQKAEQAPAGGAEKPEPAPEAAAGVSDVPGAGAGPSQPAEAGAEAVDATRDPG